MQLITIVLFVVVASAVESCVIKRCGPHEEYRWGPVCEPTCREPNKICRCNRLVKKCFCKPGYVRHKGKCIRLCDCPYICRSNEEYRWGPNCEPTCDEPDKICLCNKRVKRCFCKPGYVRLYKGGRCVPLDECPTLGERIVAETLAGNDCV